MVIVSVHKSYRWVVAICDNDLVGRKLIEDNRALDLSGNFFKGEEMSDDEAKDEIIRCVNEDATFNIVGEESVRIAMEVGIVKKEGVMKIQGIPFALILL